MKQVPDWLDWVNQRSWAFRNLMGQEMEHSSIKQPRSLSSSSTVNPLDELILVDCSGGAVTLTLETAVGCDGRKHTFKKIDSSTNAMTIDGAGSETIDGTATLSTNVEGVSFAIESDGTNWRVIGDNYSGFLAIHSMVSVLEPRFGVTGDGTTNDAAGIQDAITTAGDGGLVIFPKPTSHYFTGTTSLKFRDYQQWGGFSKAGSGVANATGTTIRYTGTGSGVYGIGLDTNTFTQEVKISGLRLIGHSSAQVLDLSGVIASRLEFLDIDSSNSSGIGILLGSTAGTGSGGANCYYNTLADITLQNSTGIGIKFLQSGDSGTNDNRVIGGKIVCATGIKFEGSGAGSLNSGNVIAFVSLENSATASGRAVHCDTGVDNLFIGNRYEYTGASALDFLFGANSSKNLILGGHFGSDVSGMRMTDNGTNNAWFACTDTSTVEAKANEFIGALTGTATNATNIGVTDAGGDTSTWPLLATGQTGTQAATTDAGLTYNAGTNALTAGSFVGALTGNADTVTVADAAADTSTWPLLGTLQTGSLAPATDAGLTYNASTNALSTTTFIGALTGDVTGNVSGNAGTATALQTARTIGGTSFNGTANIVPSLITLANEATDTTCFILFATDSTGDLQPKTNISVTLNSSTGVVTLASSILTTTDINGGTIDGTTIGAGTSAAGTFTDLTVSGNTTLGNEAGDTATINAESITRPNAPAFLSYNSASDADQTGNGATATVDFDTEVYDRSGDFAADTFTASVTGIYHLTANVVIFDTTTAMSGFDINIVTSNRTYSASTNVNIETAGNFVTLQVSADADMDAADTASVTVRVNGGAGDTADILGSSQLYTFFSGHLVG